MHTKMSLAVIQLFKTHAQCFDRTIWPAFFRHYGRVNDAYIVAKGLWVQGEN